MNAGVGVVNGNTMIVRFRQAHEFAYPTASQFTEAFFHVLTALAHRKIGIQGRVLPEDVGTSVEDMEQIKMETSFVAGLPVEQERGGLHLPLTVQRERSRCAPYL